jgi:proteasome alpha subunit
MDGSRQRAYDRGSTIFSLDGRLYQVEYAREAVKRGSTTVGVRTEDGVALAADGRPRSSLVDPDSVEKLHDLGSGLAVATAGHVADARQLVDFGRQYVQGERLRYDEAPATEPLAKAIADRIQESTQTGGTRPFGAALLLGGAIEGRPRLFELDPSGTAVEWRTAAVGAGSDAALAFLEAQFGDDRDETSDEAVDGVGVALEALAEGAEEPPTAATLDLATVDAGGVRTFDRDERASALSAAGLSQAS